MILWIVFLCVACLAVLARVSRAATAQSHLACKGYFMTSDMRRVLGAAVWDDLEGFAAQSLGLFRPYHTYDPPKIDRHVGATVLVFQLRGQKDAYGFDKFDGPETAVQREPKPDPDCTPEVPEPVLLLASRLLDFLPAGRYTMKVWFMSELGATEEKDIQSLRKTSKPRCVHRDFPALSWHQDRTPTNNNAYLFFAVLESSGNTAPQSNLLQVGRVRESLLEKFAAPRVLSVHPKDNQHVQLLAQVKGEPGAGYMINEQWRGREHGASGEVLVHTHAPLSFAYLNFDPAHNPEMLPASFREDELATRRNYVDSPDFCVRRVKLIVRISVL